MHVLKWKISRYISKDGLNSASYIKDSGNWYIAEQQNPLFSPIWEEPKMELSPNVTISNELFEGERMIWLQYWRQPREKNISFSVNKWILLLTHLQGPHPGCPGREDLGSNPRGSGWQQTSYSETIRKRHNNHRLSDIQLPREAGTPHQVWLVPEPIGIWSSFSFSPTNLTRIG